MIPKPRSTNNSEMEADEGMQQPVVLRGLLQCVAISLFFTVRYMLDVLFTPRLVQALFCWLSNCARCIWRWLWCVPVASFLALHLWGSLTCDTVVRGLLMWYTLRAGLVAFMDDQVVVGGLKKHHIWLPLLWWVTFTRVSSGRCAPYAEWKGGHRRFLCCVVPWVLRLIALTACWPTLRTSTWVTRASEPALQAPRSGPGECASFTGFPVPCDELRLIREFNTDVMPRLREAGYRAIRRAMNTNGFHGHIWHVGHACPDPSKASTRDREDYGWNLFAQHAVDNANLGHCVVSCAEAKHVSAFHVHCTNNDECLQSCPHLDM